MVKPSKSKENHVSLKYSQLSDLNPLSYDKFCFNIKVSFSQNNNLGTLGKPLPPPKNSLIIHGIL